MSYLNGLDMEIKTNLFIDTLNLIGIIPYSRKTKKPFDKTFKFKGELEENVNNALCELERPKGNYELIFPIIDNINKYKKYFINNYDENIKFWNKLLSTH